VGVAPIPAPTFFLLASFHSWFFLERPEVSSLLESLACFIAGRFFIDQYVNEAATPGNPGVPFHKGQRNDGIAVLMNRVDEAWWLP